MVSYIENEYTQLCFPCMPRSMKVSHLHIIFYHCVSAIPTNTPHIYYPGTKPTLPELLTFTCTDGRVVSVPVEIATKYVQFGTLLLDDQNGSKVKIIARKNHYDAEQINTEILQEWLTGRGKNPVTWTILVEVLRGIKLSTLAGDIEAVKCPGRPTQKYHS